MRMRMEEKKEERNNYRWERDMEEMGASEKEHKQINSLKFHLISVVYAVQRPQNKNQMFKILLTNRSHKTDK